MRVQLRDLNPPRGVAWKYGRGRGGKQAFFGLHRHFADSVGIVSQDSSLEKDGQEGQHPEGNSVSEEKATPVVSYPSLLDQPHTIEAGSPHTSPSRSHGRADSGKAFGRVQTPEPTVIEYPRSQPSPQSSYTGDPNWNTSTGVSTPVTPSPSSHASSMSTTPSSIPYPMGFYPPQPWMPPFGQQFPYTMPYVPGYPGYIMPSQQMSHPFASPTGSESSGPSAGGQVPYTGMFPVRYSSL